MTLPANWTTVPVTGQYLDAAGNPATGSVTFTMTVRSAEQNWASDATALLEDTTEALFIEPMTITVELDENGAFSVQLPASDDPDITPSFRWLVREDIEGKVRTFEADVPWLTEGTLDLTDLI